MTKHALSDFTELSGLLAGRTPALFLDYDGTLTPIVERPEFATLAPEVRAAMAGLTSLMPVAIVSGRDREDVSTLVGLSGLAYAGSHGFDICLPDGHIIHPVDVGRLRQDLDSAALELRAALYRVNGVIVELKRFALAVHYRMVDEAEVGLVDAAVARAVATRPGLRRTGGKMVFELRSVLPWDKGKAVLWLLERLGLNQPNVLPIYIGDDETDRDAFAALRGSGISIFVGRPQDAAGVPFWLEDCADVLTFLRLLYRKVAA